MIAVIDCRLPDDIKAALRSRYFDLVELPPDPRLPAPVASHPDMLMFCAMGHLVVSRGYYEIAGEELDLIARAGGLDIVLSNETPTAVYPGDVLFNAALIGNKILGKRSAVSDHIAEICNQYGLEFIDMTQGYAKCSTCVVSRDAIITSDRGVAQAARSAGIDVLLIRPGHIRLDGYDTGFIGGASGLCRDNVFFCGSLERHPDCMPITAFCAAHGKRAVSLGSGELFDAGTIFFF